MSGVMYFLMPKKTKWTKRYFSLKMSGLYHYKDTKFSQEKYLCSWREYEVYEPFVQKQKKPPSKFCFALRLQQRWEKANSHSYSLFFCVETQDILTKWMAAFNSAKNRDFVDTTPDLQQNKRFKVSAEASVLRSFKTAVDEQPKNDSPHSRPNKALPPVPVAPPAVASPAAPLTRSRSRSGSTTTAIPPTPSRAAPVPPASLPVPTQVPVPEPEPSPVVPAISSPWSSPSASSSVHVTSPLSHLLTNPYSTVPNPGKKQKPPHPVLSTPARRFNEGEPMPQKRKPMSPFAIGGEYREVAQPDDDADAMQEDGPGFQTASTPLTYTAKDSMPMSPVVLTSALTLDTRPVKTLASSLQAEEMSSPMRRIAKPRVNNFSFSSFRSLYPCLRG